MVRLYVGFRMWLDRRMATAIDVLSRREEGQASAEYALVILAAAAVALVLIAWAKSSGKLPAFFDKVIDNLMGQF
jgi:Flp pilus assembly pilin Flp